jgi:MerR family transcriptional regulator/heat shock protein HspR
VVSPGWGDLDRGLFPISVAAELAGLHPQTLRIYEREGLLDPARSAGGTRRYSRRDIEKLAEICALTADGLNLAGIRRVLALQEETRQLQAELARLRELAGQQPAPRRPRPRPGGGKQPGPGRDQLPDGSCPASRACRRAVRARSAARSSSRAVMRRAAAKVQPWPASSRIRAAKVSWRRE